MGYDWLVLLVEGRDLEEGLGPVSDCVFLYFPSYSTKGYFGLSLTTIAKTKS